MWYYNDSPFEPDPTDIKDYAGFVYIITDHTGKMYVGKKTFWAKKTLPPLKGKTRKRRSVVESNWKEYYGSSDTVNQLLAERGPGIFRRDILHLCRSKGEMGYLEAKEQFDRNVLLDDRYYNGIINCKIHRSHVQNLRKQND